MAYDGARAVAARLGPAKTNSLAAKVRAGGWAWAGPWAGRLEAVVRAMMVPGAGAGPGVSGPKPLPRELLFRCRLTTTTPACSL